eukprot:CAMPEP_0206632702 /NCGR_PEP_ID=MMETSP0325_2-20121206/69048_1 /ASSEMBLY_ACC=CAM_ASM_000347 /TAXON_ID=2866 /ORGANISM="Crypthecodinium cohnii, Strain Seligo" /LENGTH=51 /DNA_ID=CAMNT_0054158247 /DNA_START=44 /DNA_END=196 /DNA_ORIENTATION=-
MTGWWANNNETVLSLKQQLQQEVRELRRATGRKSRASEDLAGRSGISRSPS